MSQRLRLRRPGRRCAPAAHARSGLQFVSNAFDSLIGRNTTCAILDQPRALAVTVGLLCPPSTPAGVSTASCTPAWAAAEHVLVPALDLVAAGFNALLEENSELMYSAPRQLRDHPLVVLSQSGSSVEVVRLPSAGAQRRHHRLTNTADSPLKAAADAAIVTQCRTENSVSC